jgi:protein SCO1/2
MDRTIRPLVIIAAFAASLVVGLVIMLWAMGGLRTVTAPAAIGGPFQLTDQAGQAVTEQNLKGKPTLIFFGFTHCPDVCPTSLFEISEVLKAMGTDADKVNAWFVSVDPERDTAAAMKDYLSSFDPHLKGLTGEPQAVAKGLCQEGPAQGRRLHHGPYRADLFDGPRRQFRSAVQPETDAGGSRQGFEAVSLSRQGSPKACKTVLASRAGWSIRP